MIKLKHGDMDFECNSVDEAMDVVKRLRAEEDKKARREGRSHLANLIADCVGWDDPQVGLWDRAVFWTFLDSLGEPQKRILALLVRKRRVTDERLRSELQLKGNNQLAGILSGISKQAGAHNLPARAVYTIENESKSSHVTKTYVVALGFRRIADEMNWPGD